MCNVLIIPLNRLWRKSEYKDDSSFKEASFESAILMHVLHRSNPSEKWNELTLEEKKYWARRANRVCQTQEENVLKNAEYLQSYLCKRCATCKCGHGD